MSEPFFSDAFLASVQTRAQELRADALNGIEEMENRLADRAELVDVHVFSDAFLASIQTRAEELRADALNGIEEMENRLADEEGVVEIGFATLSINRKQGLEEFPEGPPSCYLMSPTSGNPLDLKLVALTWFDPLRRDMESITTGTWAVKLALPELPFDQRLWPFEVGPREPSPNAAAPGSANRLNSTELEVLRLVGQAHTNREIALIMFTSERTVAFHPLHIFHKLKLRNRVEAAICADLLGLTTARQSMVGRSCDPPIQRAGGLGRFGVEAFDLQLLEQVQPVTHSVVVEQGFLRLGTVPVAQGLPDRESRRHGIEPADV